MSGAEQDDPPPTAVLPVVEPDVGDRTEAMDLPLDLLASIPDPEDLPLAGPATDASIEIAVLATPIEPATDANIQIAEPRPVEGATDAEIPLSRIAPDERPVPIPLPASAERPIPIPLPVSAERAVPRIISRPSRPVPVAQAEEGPTAVEASVYTPEPSAPPVPLPVVHTEAIPMPRASAAPGHARPVSPRADRLAPPPPANPAAPPVAEFDEGERTNIYQPEARGPQLPRGRLTVIEGAAPGKSWYLNRARTQMGRGADNDIVLLDINVSRQHLRIDRHAQGFRVIDLESGNGTQLNGRRITREELYDGDRVLLGEHLVEFQTMDGARERVRDARSTDPNIRIEQGTAQRRVGIPRTWIIAWSVATFVAVFGTMYISRTIKARNAEADRLAAAEAQIEQAQTAKADRAWHRAREALLLARESEPELTDYDAQLSGINTEIRAEKSFRLMELRLKAGELTEARLAFGDIPEASVYRPEAIILERRLVQAERDREVKRARQERDAGRSNVARQLLDKVLAADPLHAEAKALKATLVAPATVPSAPPSAAPPSAAPPKKRSPSTRGARRTPTRPRTPKAPRTSKAYGGLMSAGDAAYRAGRLEEAQSKFSAAAGKAKGDAQAKAKKKADAAGMLATALPAAEAADRSNNSGGAVRAFDRAWKADRILGGRNGGRIRKPFARHLCREAMKAYLKRQYDRAKSLNGRALKMDPNLSQARTLAERLEKTPR